MNHTAFMDAFSAVNDIFGELSPEERLEERYYDILNHISTALVEYRIHHNMNQIQLSEKLGVTQSMISKYESGDYNISIKALNDLCGKLGFALDVSITAPQAEKNADASDIFETGDFLPEDYCLAA